MNSTRKRTSNGSNGQGSVPGTVVVSTRSPANGSRVHETLPAPLEVALDPPEPRTSVVDGIVAADALERALRYVPHTAIAVAGSRPAAMVRWLRETQRDAELLTPQRQSKAPVILVTDLPDTGANGAEFLDAIKRTLAPGGLLIAIVPNLTHARTRIAMLLGRYTARFNGSGPWLTMGDVERMLRAAAFTVIDVERQVDTIETLQAMGEGVPEPVVSMLAGDLDAMTSHFVVLAERRLSSSAARCHRRIGEIADAQRTIVREADRMEARIAELEVRVQHWGAETNRLALQDATQPDAGRRDAADRLEQELRALSDRLSADRAAEAERDGALNQARALLEQRTGEIKALASRIERARYRREVVRIRQVVGREVTRGSIVAVISRGDDDLLAFDDRRGWHFPQTEKGVYAGHHPADSQAAIRHVEELRVRGARYLVIPRTAFWWLEHYKEFNDYLQRRCRCAWRDERTCALFDLGTARKVR